MKKPSRTLLFCFTLALVWLLWQLACLWRFSFSHNRCKCSLHLLCIFLYACVKSSVNVRALCSERKSQRMSRKEMFCVCDFTVWRSCFWADLQKSHQVSLGQTLCQSLEGFQIFIQNPIKDDIMTGDLLKLQARIKSNAKIPHIIATFASMREKTVN